MSSYQGRVSLYLSLGKWWLEINKMRLSRRVNISTLFSGNMSREHFNIILWKHYDCCTKYSHNKALNSYCIRSRRNFNNVTSFLHLLQKHRKVLGNSKRVISFYRFRQKYILEYAEYVLSETANSLIK